MSTIQTQINLIHLDSGLSAGSAVQRTAVEASFSSDSLEVVNVEEAVDLGDVTIPKQIFFKFLSGDPLMIGLDYGTDGVTYPFLLEDAGESLLLRLNAASPATVYMKSTIASSQVVVAVAPA